MTMIANKKAREPRITNISSTIPFDKPKIISHTANNKLKIQVTCNNRTMKDFKITPLNYSLSFDEVATIAAKYQLDIDCHYQSSKSLELSLFWTLFGH